MCSSLPIMLFKRELGMATCLTNESVWCDKHHKDQIVTREFCRKHVNGFLTEGYDNSKIYTEIKLCKGRLTDLVYINAEDRRQENIPKYPSYSLSFFDNYVEEDEEQEEEEEEEYEEEYEEEEPNVSCIYIFFIVKVSYSVL
jgi:hypothetical protein